MDYRNTYIIWCLSNIYNNFTPHNNMTFIRKKKIKGKIYYYLVKNSLVNGKVKQKVVHYIGTADTLLDKLKIKH